MGEGRTLEAIPHVALWLIPKWLQIIDNDIAGLNLAVVNHIVSLQCSSEENRDGCQAAVSQLTDLAMRSRMKVPH
jgi:hypothetical protein